MFDVLSLFSGIGGIDLGLERTGWYRTVAYSEIDLYASLVMEKRFPHAVNLGDVTCIDWSDAPPVDVIVGGFPCQDISLAGKGAGIDGERSGLWRQYADAIRILRPRGVIVENVAALLHRGLDRVLGDLAACGYDAEWDCIPAAAVGAPHRRDRLFIIGYGTDLDYNDKHDGSNTNGERFQKLKPTNQSSDKIITSRDVSERQTIANSKNIRREQRKPEPIGNQPWPTPWSGITSNAMRVGQSGSRESKQPISTTSNTDRQTGHARADSWWSIEPQVGRVAHGIPNRVDRLRCLGNAVVPQVAEHVGRVLFDRIGGVNA